ncbi:hypothetical protein LTR10_006537 [Elasticomyces elasticus]|nr:hypothetical protein LTR10_006537 [Elasticomyces elasticus]KAK4973062.1 hypothetical protein LTR42_006356 [Elasticomyces elasticus]
MATINVADWFGKDKYSDVTLKFGDREFRAHRLVLEQSSVYFKQILEENTTGIIKLEEDPEAMECMLRYIYTFKYLEGEKRKDEWCLHLKVAAVAAQYGVEALLETAVHCFQLVGPLPGQQYREGRDMLALLPKYRHLHPDLGVRERSLHNRWFLPLLSGPEYRSLFCSTPDRAQCALGRFAAALIEIKEFAGAQSGKGAILPYVLTGKVEEIVTKALNGVPLGQ